MPPADILHMEPHPLWDSRRLWSLADMIDFGLVDFVLSMRALQAEIDRANRNAQGAPGMLVASEVNEAFAIVYNFVKNKVIVPLHFEETKLTASRLEFLFERGGYYTYTEIAGYLERLRDEIRSGSTNHYFFHYPRQMAELFRSIKDDWADVLVAFPALKREIQAGIDCYAMGDHPGCVFHMIRIAEEGLREIARDVGIKSLVAKRGERMPIEWGTWDQIFTAINNKSAEAKKKSQGPKRDRLFAYYDTALTELKWMRNLYRDPTMHYRETYGRGEAFDAIGRTKNLLIAIARKRGKPRGS